MRIMRIFIKKKKKAKHCAFFMVKFGKVHPVHGKVVEFCHKEEIEILNRCFANIY